MSPNLAHPPVAAESGRARLLSLILRYGILRATDTQNIASRNGRRGTWMLYLWPLTMSAEGLQLVAEEMLRLLEPFGPVQVAANGFGAVPLVTAVVNAGRGRYTGLCVRPEQKRHGAMRRIDGAGDRSRPVVVVDDSISSGTSFREACAALENEGYRVDGTACLVDFPTRGGREWAEGRGYRVATSFDIWRDLGLAGDEPLPGYINAMPAIWSAERVPDHLHPAAAARRVAEHFLATGRALRPPAAFDQLEDGRGGTFVSLRRRTNDSRVARNGFWHFDPADADPYRDLVIATIQTLRAMQTANAPSLDAVKIGVTFFGPLERVEPNALDFARYGVVVRSTVVPAKRGGALPNTQRYTSTFEQYRHARWVNARIFDLEPHDVYRHEVSKRTEPDESWPPYGDDDSFRERWLSEPTLGSRLLDRTAEILIAHRTGKPLPTASALPARLFGDAVGVAVTLYGHGLVGCNVVRSTAIDENTLARAAVGAFTDGRFATTRAASPGVMAFSVSLLHGPEHLGVVASERVAKKLRRGRDSLAIKQGTRSAIYLDSVLVHHSWTTSETLAALTAKAGITEGPVAWTTFKTASWLRSGTSTYALDNGSCRRPPDQTIGRADVALLAEHLVRRLDLNGWPAYLVHPLSGRFERRGTAARCLHALRQLDEAGRYLGRSDWCAAVARGIDFAVAQLRLDPEPTLQIPDHRGGIVAEAALLGLVAGARHPTLQSPAIDALARKVHACVNRDGGVFPPGTVRSRADADLIPGILLFNLATYGLAVGNDLGLDWPSIRAWYVRRARLLGAWGLMAWHAQVWHLVSELTGDAAYHQTVLELCDRMCAGQLRADGSFLTDMCATGPSFHTAFAAEGMAAGWRSALLVGDVGRTARFSRSWSAAMTFTDKLLLRREDTYWTPEPTLVLGAVRSQPTNSILRVDFTSHVLQALVGGLRAAELHA